MMKAINTNSAKRFRKEAWLCSGSRDEKGLDTDAVQSYVCLCVYIYTCTYTCLYMHTHVHITLVGSYVLQQIVELIILEDTRGFSWLAGLAGASGTLRTLMGELRKTWVQVSSPSSSKKPKLGCTSCFADLWGGNPRNLRSANGQIREHK